MGSVCGTSIAGQSSSVMVLNSRLLKSFLLNKRTITIAGFLVSGLLFLYSICWRMSGGYVVTFLSTSQQSIGVSKCNCTLLCRSFSTLLPSASNKGSVHSLNKTLEDSIKESRLPHSESNIQGPVNEDTKGYRYQRFPQAIIIGVRKSGTRALIDMLNLHPHICAARTEVHFFDREDNFLKGVQWYIEKMPFTINGQITIEKSPSYFVVDKVPHRIYMFSPRIKLLLIVRNPIERLISDYLQLDSKRLKKNGSRYTFEELAFRSSGEVDEHYSPVTVSMYGIHFQKWLKHFNLDQIHIVDGNALIANPILELQKVEEFLGVNTYFNEEMFYFNETKGFYCWKKSGKSTCLGDGKGREHPLFPEKVQSKLREFFTPHNTLFFKLCQCRFNWG